MKNPKTCKGCEERALGCHSKCVRYIQYRDELDERNKEERRNSELYNAVSHVIRPKYKSRGGR